MAWINELPEGTRVRHLDGTFGTLVANDNSGLELGVRDVAWDDGDYGAADDSDITVIHD